jgi:hypothetical protein
VRRVLRGDSPVSRKEEEMLMDIGEYAFFGAGKVVESGKKLPKVDKSGSSD